MPPILDVAIGTVFIFLLFSLVVSAATEMLMAFFDQRAKFLQIGLREILSYGRGDGAASDAKASVWVQDLCNHGLVNALSKTKKGQSLPTYIPATAFRIALFDLIRRDWGKGPNAKDEKAIPLDLDNLTEAISHLPQKSKLRESLLSLLDSQAHDLKSFETAVEKWFNATMDRTSAWYKNHAQKAMICLGLLLAIALNVDTIRIVRALSSDPALRAAIVEQAKAYNSDDRNTATTKTNDPAAEVQEKIDTFKADIARLGGTGIPIGWDFTDPPKPPSCCWDIFLLALAAITTLCGWFLTAVAASFGAPFWFDILNRFINIRNGGKAPGEKSATDSTPIENMPSLSKV